MSAIQETKQNPSLHRLCNIEDIIIAEDPEPVSQDLFDKLLEDSNFEIVCIPSEKPKPKKNKGCKCTKTQCVKMYCDCFSQGLLCTEDCACLSCSNHSLSEVAVSLMKQRRIHTNDRYSSLLSENGQVQFKKGCTCKKSGCEKNYCDCFARGEKCTDACVCKNCTNSFASHDSTLEQMIEQH